MGRTATVSALECRTPSLGTFLGTFLGTKYSVKRLHTAIYLCCNTTKQSRTGTGGPSKHTSDVYGDLWRAQLGVAARPSVPLLLAEIA